MYKSRFTYFGQVGSIFIMGLCVLVSLGRLLFGLNEIPDREKGFLIFVFPLIIFIVTFLCRKILIEIKEIEINATGIIFKNILTRRIREIQKDQIKGYKDTYRNGYTILLVGHSDDVIMKIQEHYYVNFKELIDHMELTYIGRVPTFWERTIKAKADR